MVYVADMRDFLFEFFDIQLALLDLEPELTGHELVMASHFILQDQLL